MLDAYIIDKIKREEESSKWQPMPLQIEIPYWPHNEDYEKNKNIEEKQERNVLIIDID